MTGVTQGKLRSPWGSLGPEDKEVSPSCGQLRPKMGADGQPDSRAHGGLGGCLWRVAGRAGFYCVNPFVHFIFCAMQVFYISKKIK